MPGTYSKLLYHVTFSTKRRARLITTDLQPRLHEYMGGIVRNEQGVAYQIGGTADHVHMLIRWRTDESIATLLRTILNQAKHHDNQTFEEELVAFLKAHQIEYDERYLLD